MPNSYPYIGTIPTAQTLTVSDSSPLDRKGPYSSNIVGVSFGHLVKASTARTLAKQVRQKILVLPAVVPRSREARVTAIFDRVPTLPCCIIHIDSSVDAFRSAWLDRQCVAVNRLDCEL